MKACIPFLLLGLIASCKSGDDMPKKHDMVFAPANTKSVKLPVKVLPTEDGAKEEAEVKAFKYPPEMSLYGLDNIDEVAAYGAAYQLWLGPKGWMGNGLSAANGGVRVDLYPAGGEKLTGPHIDYYQEPACQGCILSNAAKYFPKAFAAYSEMFDGNPPAIDDTAGLVINRVSESLVTFTRPAKNGLITRGVAYYSDTADKYFTEATFVMSADKAGLIDLLQKQFISTLPH